MFGMPAELLLIPDCPNERAAQELLRVALDDVGLARTPIRTIIVGSQQDAEQRSFVGSPTILLDGLDPFPVRCRAGASLPHLRHAGRPCRDPSASGTPTSHQAGCRGPGQLIDTRRDS